MLTVHLRINDAATGKPTPVRVRVTGPDGTHFAPLGRAPEFPLGRNEAVGGHLAIARERWFYADGACEIPLPAGVPLRVQVAKGVEYTPLDTTITLGAGQMALRFAVERWADTAADGWVTVDTRCHFLTPHDALLEAAAEGVGVANLLAVEQRFPSQDGTAYQMVPNLAAFSGQTPAVERDATRVMVNTFNTHPVLGKVALLNSHRPVFPLSFGGEDATDDWGVCDWCDQCHRKGGLVVWVDAFEPTGGVTGGEALVAAVLGKIDAIEVTGGTRKTPLLPAVYQLWNAGVLVPLVGGSGKDSNKVRLGTMRTYAKVSANGSEPAVSATWLDAVRAGRTFATDGPLLEFMHDAGNVRAAARSPRPCGNVELVANGRVIATSTAVAEAEWAGPGWVAARCVGSDFFAHTSPVRIGPPARNPVAVAELLRLIGQTRGWAEANGRYANPKRRDQLFARCAEAAEKLGGAL